MFQEKKQLNLNRNTDWKTVTLEKGVILCQTTAWAIRLSVGLFSEWGLINEITYLVPMNQYSCEEEEKSKLTQNFMWIFKTQLWSNIFGFYSISICLVHPFLLQYLFQYLYKDNQYFLQNQQMQLYSWSQSSHADPGRCRAQEMNHISSSNL